MKTVHEITDEWAGSRIDRFVRGLYPELAFPMIQILLRKGRILVNGARAPGGTRLETGDAVEIDTDDIAGIPTRPKPEPPGTGVKPSRGGPARGNGIPAGAGTGRIGREIGILYEDRHLLVINKPGGIVVQPGNRKERGSLLDLLEEYRSRTARDRRDNPAFAYVPVHRLDRMTTGVLLIAKTRSAARSLSRAIADGMVGKRYLAMVEGIPSPPSGTISTPLELRKGRRSRALPSPDGKSAVSCYSAIGMSQGDRTLLEVTIRTGRTHQIRAHLASIGHPVVGDRYYGWRGMGKTLMLHAWKITFPHPAGGNAIELTAPPPEGMAP